MASCPNCGRRTQRTIDWVCQWCGYPLLSGGYKQIDKTFKEFQADMIFPRKSERPDPGPEIIKYEPELKEESGSDTTDKADEREPELKEEPKLEELTDQQPAAQAEPEPRSEVLPEPEPELKEESGSDTTEKADEREPELKEEPKLAELTDQQPAAQAEPEPRSEVLPEPVPDVPEEAPQTAPQVEETKAEAIVVPSLKSIQDGMQLTIDQIDALFQADNIGASRALKDKTLIVKGIVNKIFIRDHIEIRYLILIGARQVSWSARCSFEKKNAGPIGRLIEGKAVALRGKYDGYGRHIIFKDCELLASN